MTAYAVATYTTGPNDLATVIEALHDKLETLDSSTNTIRLITIQSVARDRDLCVGAIIYDG